MGGGDGGCEVEAVANLARSRSLRGTQGAGAGGAYSGRSLRRDTRADASCGPSRGEAAARRSLAGSFDQGATAARRAVRVDPLSGRSPTESFADGGRTAASGSTRGLPSAAWGGGERHALKRELFRVEEGCGPAAERRGLLRAFGRDTALRQGAAAGCHCFAMTATSCQSSAAVRRSRKSAPLRSIASKKKPPRANRAGRLQKSADRYRAAVFVWTRIAPLAPFEP